MSQTDVRGGIRGLLALAESDHCAWCGDEAFYTTKDDDGEACEPICPECGNYADEKPYEPCPGCPWKKSTKTHHIPGGGMKDACFADLDSRQGAMGCHLNPGKPARPCSGFMVKEGFNAIGVRLGALQNIAHPNDHIDGGYELYESLDEMLAAHYQGVT